MFQCWLLRRLFTWLIKFEPRWRNLEDPFEEDEPHVAGLRGFRKPMHGKPRKKHKSCWNRGKEKIYANASIKNWKSSVPCLTVSEASDGCNISMMHSFIIYIYTYDII